MSGPSSLFSPYKREPFMHLSDAALEANSRLHEKLQSKPAAVSPKKVSRLRFSTRSGKSLPKPSESSPHKSPKRSHRRTNTEHPSSEETRQLLIHYESYIQQLETENSYSKEELRRQRVQIMGLLADNTALGDEKAQAVTNVIRIISSPQDSPEKKVLFAESTGDGATVRGDLDKWRKELDQIVALHKSKSERLEMELRQSREDLGRCEQTCSGLRAQLKQCREGMLGEGSHPITLCHVCATSDLDTLRQYYTEEQQTELRDQKDRLMEDLLATQRSMSAMAERETEACTQVSAAMSLAEEAETQKGQILLEREQLRDQLTAAQQRFEAALAQHKEDVAEETRVACRSAHAQIQILDNKLQAVTDAEFLAKEELARVSKDKANSDVLTRKYRQELEELEKATTEDHHNLKRTVTQMALDRNAALDDRDRLKNKMRRLENAKDDVVLRVKTELVEVKGRLDMAEQQLLASKDECIQLNQANQTLEQELDKWKQTCEKIERGKTSDQQTLESRMEEREQELTLLLSRTEGKYLTQIAEMEEMVTSQAGLVESLKEECKTHLSSLEKKTAEYIDETSQLNEERDAAVKRYTRCIENQRLSEDQQMESAHLQDKLRNRLTHMDQLNHQQARRIEDLIQELHVLRGQLNTSMTLPNLASCGHMTSSPNKTACGHTTSTTRAPPGDLLPDSTVTCILDTLTDDMIAQGKSLMSGLSIIREAAAIGGDQSYLAPSPEDDKPERTTV